MRADPRVDVKAVAPGPAREVLHGRQRIPAFECWPDRRDDTPEPSGGGPVAEGSGGLPGQPATLPVGSDGGGHAAERVGRDWVFVGGYRADRCPVVAVRQGADCSSQRMGTPQPPATTRPSWRRSTSY